MSFYNISNHPSPRWGYHQKKATNSEEIIDLPFPNIPPATTLQEVEAMAIEFSNKIPENSQTMVTGEPTFCAALVKELQNKNCKCFVACSERNSVFNEDGSKTIVFDFIQFREWPQLG